MASFSRHISASTLKNESRLMHRTQLRRQEKEEEQNHTSTIPIKSSAGEHDNWPYKS